MQCYRVVARLGLGSAYCPCDRKKLELSSDHRGLALFEVRSRLLFSGSLFVPMAACA